MSSSTNSSSYSNTFIASAFAIAQKCTKPDEVLEAMKHTMKETITLIHSRYVVDLLQDLAKGKHWDKHCGEQT